MPEGGRIIVIGSVNGDRIPFPSLSAYAMSKSALQGMARGLARDFGPRGITVNVVQPGPIDTDLNPADGPMKDIQHAVMAIKHHGRPEDVAGMVAWLTGAGGGLRDRCHAHHRRGLRGLGSGRQDPGLPAMGLTDAMAAGSAAMADLFWRAKTQV